MQKKLVLFIVFVLLVTPVLAIGIRPAKSDDATIISQNFDNESTGYHPSWWVPTWPTVCFLTVNDTIYHGSSGKSARYVDTVSNSTGYSDVERGFLARGGQLEFSFAIMAENPDYFSLYIDNGYFCGANIYFLPNMTLAYYDGEYHCLRQFSLNTWYEIKMDINATAHMYDIYIDGSLEAQGAHFSEYGQTWFLNRIVFGENPYGMPSGYIDDLSLIAHVNPPEPSALLKIVNPLTGDEWFNFTTYDKKVGDTFILNVTIANVERMVTWQFALQWNSSLLECVNATIPSDNVFAYWNSTDEPLVVGGPVLSHSGLVLYGATIAYPSNVGFNGSGVLAQVEFKILQKGGQSELSFEGVIPHLGDTFLLHINLSEIPFVPISAHYSYNDSGQLGDVNGDGTVDMKDVMTVILAFNSFPNTPRWNSLADLDSNGRIDMRDIVIVVLNFKHG